jgi:hypothetical protein
MGSSHFKYAEMSDFSNYTTSYVFSYLYQEKNSTVFHIILVFKVVMILKITNWMVTYNAPLMLQLHTWMFIKSPSVLHEGSFSVSFFSA